VTTNPNPYAGLVKRLVVPSGSTMPRELVSSELRATAITRHDLSDDVAGINASIDLIKRTRGGRWPSEPVTEEFNYVDLVWHECEFREGDSYTYVVRDHDGGYVGCLYLYPVGRRSPLTPETIGFDVDVSWWVTPPAFERGLYVRLYDDVVAWLERSLPFTRPLFSNATLPRA
jgi:hypothetical protein